MEDGVQAQKAQGCGRRGVDVTPVKFQLQQEVSTTEVRPLSKAPNPQLLPGRCTSAAHCSTWMG